MYRIVLIIITFLTLTISADSSNVWFTFFDSSGNFEKTPLLSKQTYVFNYPSALIDSNVEYRNVGFTIDFKSGPHFYCYQNGEVCLYGYTQNTPTFLSLPTIDADTNSYLFISGHKGTGFTDSFFVDLAITGEGWIHVHVPALKPANTGSINILQTPIIINEIYKEHLKFHEFLVEGIVKGSMNIYLDDFLLFSQDSLFTGFSTYCHEVLDTLKHEVTFVTYDMDSAVFDSASYFIRNTSVHSLTYYDGWYETSMKDSLYFKIDSDQEISIESASKPLIVRDISSNLEQYTTAKLIVYNKSSNIEKVDIAFKKTIQFPYSERHILSKSYIPGVSWVFGEKDIITKQAPNSGSRGNPISNLRRSEEVIDTIKISITQKDNTVYEETILCVGYYLIVGINDKPHSVMKNNYTMSISNTSHQTIIKLPVQFSNIQCSIFNIEGKKIRDVRSSNNTIYIEKKQLPSGTFFLHSDKLKPFPFSIVK